MMYSLPGFELNNTNGQTVTLQLSKTGDITIRYHREIPTEADVKEVTVKKEMTGDWFVSFGLENRDADLPEKSAVNSLNARNSVGIDLGIRNFLEETIAFSHRHLVHQN